MAKSTYLCKDCNLVGACPIDKKDKYLCWGFIYAGCYCNNTHLKIDVDDNKIKYTCTNCHATMTFYDVNTLDIYRELGMDN